MFAFSIVLLQLCYIAFSHFRCHDFLFFVFGLVHEGCSASVSDGVVLILCLQFILCVCFVFEGVGVFFVFHYLLYFEHCVNKLVIVVMIFLVCSDSSAFNFVLSGYSSAGLGEAG